MQYLSLEEVLYLHSRIIKRTGGRAGIRDLSLLESAIHRPAVSFGGEDLYPDIFSKAAAILYSLINNHPFVDGNKRTGFAAMARFLLVNGYPLRTKKDEALHFVLFVEAKKIDLEKIAAWLKKHSRKLR